MDRLRWHGAPRTLPSPSHSRVRAGAHLPPLPYFLSLSLLIQHHHRGLFLEENNRQHQGDVWTLDTASNLLEVTPPSLPINTASESAYTHLPSYLVLDVFDLTMVRFDNRSNSCHWSSSSVLVEVERVCVSWRITDTISYGIEGAPAGQDVSTNTGRCQPRAWNSKRSTFGSVCGIPFNIET